ncbi:GNAT family N-acetyltransferase [Nocardioides sp. zg-1228]|uniref:GNAT family N-acetyltransferase n=1 Tax=Nocardioides sp. zg-1228 TaxID=2763008 RepID=UPI0016423C60|nr:GNAT family N-acetyltransferase [Nocardioides sp. zg-1228]MBC2932033.1 GNAT family N-acetyltransferase [Nocardioides sp. zg-1228]QSF57585.1 GNAT family N-acetyltransferase [Nocardioides sp. zg-1228]
MIPSPYPMRTERLTLRLPRAEDVPALTAYRNDPEVAALQVWELPWSEERALELVARHAGLTDLADGGRHQVLIEQDGRVVGDLFVGLHEHGGVAHLGFTLARAAQGQGIATEAASAVVADLVERLGVHRVVAELSPRNLASARLLERLGMTFEVETHRSFWWRGGWDDNLVYAMSAAQWRAWRDRPRTPPTDVRLVEITDDTFRRWTRVGVHHTQQRFVATVQQSFVDALFPGTRDGVPLVADCRGIEADGDPAGFLMWSESPPRPYLWRFLVDRRHQGRGIGRRALDLWVRAMRERGHAEAETSWVQAPGGPEAFYLASGFVPTGEHDDGEALARLRLG